MSSTPPRPWWQLPEVLLASLAVASRLWLTFALYTGTFPTENVRTGLNLARTGEFASPFIEPTGPTAHVAPGYPSVIATGVWLTGNEQHGLLFARTVLIIVFGAFVALLPRIATWLGLDRKIGLVAAMAFVPPTPPVFVWIEAMGQHETILATFILACGSALTIRALQRESVPPTLGGWIGALWGVGCLFAPTLLLPALSLLVLGWWWHRRSPRSVLTFAALYTMSIGLATSPWVVRNRVMLGEASFIRDNFGLELSIAYADDASADMRENMLGRRTMVTHPFFDSTEARLMARMGESAYYRARGLRASQWIMANPGASARLTFEHVGLFFLPKLGWEHHAAFYICVLLLLPVGVLFGLRDNPRVTVALLAVMLSFAAPHFLVQSSPRYSYPVLWVMVLLACVGGAGALRSLRARCGRGSG